LRSAEGGPEVAELLEPYRFLRLLEARSRWVNGRSSEAFWSRADAAECVAELVEPGCSLAELLRRIEQARKRILAAYQRVIHQRTIRAL
jgi:hypothetical protein